MRVVLNPAPAQPIDPAVLACLHLITPNETEAELLTGIRVTDDATAQQAARRLHEAGVANVVITLGARISLQPKTLISSTPPCRLMMCMGLG